MNNAFHMLLILPLNCYRYYGIFFFFWGIASQSIQASFMQVQRLQRELLNAQKSRKVASLALRAALQKAAQLRLMEKEKNKSPSYAMRISLQINKVVWSMLVDGKSFAEAEINDMVSMSKDSAWVLFPIIIVRFSFHS